MTPALFVADATARVRAIGGPPAAQWQSAFLTLFRYAQSVCPDGHRKALCHCVGPWLRPHRETGRWGSLAGPLPQPCVLSVAPPRLAVARSVRWTLPTPFGAKTLLGARSSHSLVHGSAQTH